MTHARTRIVVPLLALSVAFALGGLAGWTLGRRVPADIATEGFAQLAPVRDPSHFRLLARNLVGESRFEEVAETAQRGLAMFPGDTVLAGLHAFAVFKQGEVSRAEREYRALLERHPRDRQLQAELATVVEARAALERTLDEAQAALADDATTDARPQRLALAQAAIGLERSDEALRAYQTLIAADAADHVAWNGAGLALMSLGQPDLARIRFAQATQLAPRDVEYARNLQRADRAVH